jgi:hypothetical protein
MFRERPGTVAGTAASTQPDQSGHPLPTGYEHNSPMKVMFQKEKPRDWEETGLPVSGQIEVGRGRDDCRTDLSPKLGCDRFGSKCEEPAPEVV